MYLGHCSGTSFYVHTKLITPFAQLYQVTAEMKAKLRMLRLDDETRKKVKAATAAHSAAEESPWTEVWDPTSQAF